MEMDNWISKSFIGNLIKYLRIMKKRDNVFDDLDSDDD
jgi:hypothetical protein